MIQTKYRIRWYKVATSIPMSPTKRHRSIPIIELWPSALADLTSTRTSRYGTSRPVLVKKWNPNCAPTRNLALIRRCERRKDFRTLAWKGKILGRKDRCSFKVKVERLRRLWHRHHLELKWVGQTIPHTKLTWSRVDHKMKALTRNLFRRNQPCAIPS